MLQSEPISIQAARETSARNGELHANAAQEKPRGLPSNLLSLHLTILLFANHHLLRQVQPLVTGAPHKHTHTTLTCPDLDLESQPELQS